MMNECVDVMHAIIRKEYCIRKKHKIGSFGQVFGHRPSSWCYRFYNFSELEVQAFWGGWISVPGTPPLWEESPRREGFLGCSTACRGTGCWPHSDPRASKRPCTLPRRCIIRHTAWTVDDRRRTEKLNL